MKLLSNASSPLVVVVVAMLTAVEVVISPIIVDAAGSIRKEHPRGHQQQQLLPTGRRRRRLLHRRKFPSGLTCNLFLKDVEYGPNADKPQGYSIEEWFCELSEDDSHRLGVERPYYLDIADMARVCREADIVVSERRLPRTCNPRWLKLDRWTLRDTGGVAISFAGPRVTTVRRGTDHPWLNPPRVAPPWRERRRYPESQPTGDDRTAGNGDPE